MNKEAFIEYIERYKREGKKVFATSSFQTQSVPLLHLISEIDKNIPVFCLNTGYFFPETLAFRDELKETLGLNIIELFSSVPKSMQRDSTGRLLFTNDTDYCCHINKVEPLEPILYQYDIWISGVRGDQSAIRKAMNVEQVQFMELMKLNENSSNEYRDKCRLIGLCRIIEKESTSSENI